MGRNDELSECFTLDLVMRSPVLTPDTRRGKVTKSQDGSGEKGCTIKHPLFRGLFGRQLFGIGQPILFAIDADV